MMPPQTKSAAAVGMAIVSAALSEHGATGSCAGQRHNDDG
jgi:hypothetical protein